MVDIAQWLECLPKVVVPDGGYSSVGRVLVSGGLFLMVDIGQWLEHLSKMVWS